MYYIDQPQIQYFLLGLVKIESELLDQLRLTQGYESWWKLWLMLILIIFHRPDLSPWGYRHSLNPSPHEGKTIQKPGKIGGGWRCFYINGEVNHNRVMSHLQMGDHPNPSRVTLWPIHRSYSWYVLIRLQYFHHLKHL